jgi:hypothetical protein
VERGFLGLAACLYGSLLGFVLHGLLLFIGLGLFSRGCGETGTGSVGTSPPPPYPTRMSFSPFRSPRGLKCYHPRPLMEEFPAGNRGSGPRCHPYAKCASSELPQALTSCMQNAGLEREARR